MLLFYFRVSCEPGSKTKFTIGSKKITKLRATTEPFIPTSQKIYETLDKNGITAKVG